MEGRTDDLRWFGEGFDGFPKILPEDCMEYMIYVIDPKLDDSGVREKLREVQSTAKQLTRKLLKGFIWQRESFELNFNREKGRSLLSGRTDYGDSIEDEWLIVYILQELSKQFTNIWIRLFDSDGEFLLIEAANALPLWLNPEIADHRAWINEGRLLIIPTENPGGKSRQRQAVNDTLDLEAALKIIESPTAKILHSTKIENEAFYRLQKYPQQVSDSQHFSLIKVPRNLAFVLHDDPTSISSAIEAFYLRDPVALRPLSTTDSRKLIFRPEDFVTMSAKFNKIGFAQLISQHFSAPPSWAAVSLIKGDAKAKARAELGMKVACGFEMLMSDPQNRDKKAYREISTLVEDINTGDAYLPTDDDIREWGLRDDDESWLDINFEDFEKELNGKGRQSMQNDGFGDHGVQDNLRKMVSRFEDFLNDDEAGADGAEFLDEMDHDEDSSTVSESDESEVGYEEAGDLDVNEDEFTKMMREMMGMPQGVMKEIMAGKKRLQAGSRLGSTPSEDGDADDARVVTHGSEIMPHHQEGDEVSQSMDQIEQELRAAGALDLESADDGGIKKRSPDNATETGSSGLDESSVEPMSEEIDDLDVSTNLVKNMLESFKSQGGAAGPGGNLLGLLGMRLPRDERQDD